MLHKIVDWYNDIFYKYVGSLYVEFKTSDEFGQVEYSAFQNRRSACMKDESVGPFNAYSFRGKLKKNHRLYLSELRQIPFAVSGWVMILRSNYSSSAVKLDDSGKILKILECKDVFLSECNISNQVTTICGKEV